MLKLNKFKIVQSDRLNFKIEEFRLVEDSNKKTSEEKWVKLPEFYGSLYKALEALLRGDMLNKLLPEEEISINSLLDRVNDTYKDLITGTITIQGEN